MRVAVGGGAIERGKRNISYREEHAESGGFDELYGFTGSEDASLPAEYARRLCSFSLHKENLTQRARRVIETSEKDRNVFLPPMRLMEARSPFFAARTKSADVGTLAAVGNHVYFARPILKLESPSFFRCVVLFLHERGKRIS
jgi:hypothetical protein